MTKEVFYTISYEYKIPPHEIRKWRFSEIAEILECLLFVRDKIKESKENFISSEGEY